MAFLSWAGLISFCSTSIAPRWSVSGRSPPDRGCGRSGALRASGPILVVVSGPRAARPTPESEATTCGAGAGSPAVAAGAGVSGASVAVGGVGRSAAVADPCRPRVGATSLTPLAVRALVSGGLVPPSPTVPRRVVAAPRKKRPFRSRDFRRASVRRGISVPPFRTATAGRGTETTPGPLHRDEVAPRRGQA